MVAVGDFVSFRQPLRRLQNGQVTGKSLDNRASVAAVTVALSYLQTRQHTWDVVAVATAQEETALLGAYTSGHAQQPELAAVLPAPADDLAAPLALVLALGHLAGLLPWFADGRHLWTGGSR